MQKKQRPTRSLDGFIPQQNRPRQVGFGVSGRPPARPANFPTVGKTLSSYKPSGTFVTPGPELPAPILPTMELDDIPSRSQGKTKKRSKKARSSHKKIWKRGLITLLVVFLGIGGWLGFKFIYNASKAFHGNVLGVLASTKLRGEDQGRVNILLAGNSSDDVGHQGGELTDSIMIVSLDTKQHTAFMLSVPRDLYVDIPGYDHAKINEAYVDGEDGKFSESGYFPGGMGLLQKVLQDNFDIKLQYYSLIDYNAFRDMVNAVGGITFNVQSKDPRGLYDPSIDYTTHGPLVKLTNGPHTLNGQQALDLARARGDAYGSYGFPAADFDRTNNQRQELLALKSKVVSTGVLANPLKISKLMDAVGSNVKTDFSLSEIHRLYDIGKGIDGAHIQSVGLNNVQGKNLLAGYTTFNGQSALIPAAGLDDFSDIQALLRRLTSSNPIVKEGARVVVLNATATSGLASQAAKTLKSKQLDVVATDNAATQQATSSIIDLSGGKMPATRNLLMSLYGKQITTTNPYNYDADFVVLIGADKVPTPSSSTSASSTSH